eukprot:Gb_30572 [translate_table: standard]
MINMSREAPEKKITLFALRLALLEKTSNGLGTLGFIWATVVLLGGIADSLEKIDFWFMTIILLIEGTRIFSRSHELLWQHEALKITSFKKEAKPYNLRMLSFHGRTTFLTKILTPYWIYKELTRKPNGEKKDVNDLLCGKPNESRNNSSPDNLVKRTWSASNVPFLPYAGWLFLSKNVSRLLYWLQLLFGVTCVVLSLYCLSKQDYATGDNLRSILNIFYGLALAEALVFLVERFYWQISVQKLLVEVNNECGLNHAGLHTIRSFFYDAYSECVNGSIFDGLKMDLVSYSNELLQSSGSHGQLSGARLLSAFVRSDRFGEETIRKVGTMQDVVERLIEMLNWKNCHEQEIRRAAAEIISKLVKKNRNCLRIAGIAGSLDSISSLLTNSKKYGLQSTDKITEKDYDYTAFNLLGLRILKNLAKDHDNCDKIASTRGLLPKIIGFTAPKEAFLRNGTAGATDSQIGTVKRSLQLLKMVTSSHGMTGKVLRQEISGIVFTVSNLRDILLYAESHAKLQTLAVGILTDLAMDEEAAERIGSTGGVLKSLFRVFFKERIEGDENEARLVFQCGEALTILAFHNINNCLRMMKLNLNHRMKKQNVMRNLIAGLKDPVQRVQAASILHNFCAYAGSNCEELKDRGAALQALELVMKEQGRVQEAAIGLAAQIFNLLEVSEIDSLFVEAGMAKISLGKQLVEVLEKYSFPSNKFPSIRRFTLQLVICLLQKEKSNEESCFGSSERLGMQSALEGMMDSTSELENFFTFSGSVGLSRHYTTVQSLLESAMDLLGRSAHNH